MIGKEGAGVGWDGVVVSAMLIIFYLYPPIFF